MTPSSADLSLPAALHACAHGLYPQEAGVGLLISHACWLHRQDFQDEFIHAGISIADRVHWTPTGFVDTIRSGTMVYEERTGSGTGSQEVHPGI